MNTQLIFQAGRFVKNSLKRVLSQEYDVCKRRLLSLLKIDEPEHFLHMLGKRNFSRLLI